MIWGKIKDLSYWGVRSHDFNVFKVKFNLDVDLKIDSLN